MKITSYYPVLCVADVARSAAFYGRHFGFVPAFETDWYMHITLPSEVPVNLGLVQAEHPTVPAGQGRAGGLLINFEVENVDAVYERMRHEGMDMLLELRSEDFGQRHFIARDPDGVMLDVIQPIAPSAEFADKYLTEVPA